MSNPKKNEFHSAHRKFGESPSGSRGKPPAQKTHFVKGAKVTPKRSPA